MDTPVENDPYAPVEKTLVVPDSSVGSRADIFLSRNLDISRSAASKLFEKNRVSSDKRLLLKADKLASGQEIIVTQYEADNPIGLIKVHPDLNIVYHDDDLLVLEKPKAMTAHAAPAWRGYTVVGSLNALGISISTSGDPYRQGIVHRLDAGTTGLMVVAKNERAYVNLRQQFKDRKVKKIYHGLTSGVVSPKTAIIDAPIGRHPYHEGRFAVVEGGKDAVTDFETLENFSTGPYHSSLVQVRLETGRTHQIRVHLASLGFPLIGDRAYGASKDEAKSIGLERQWLHAHQLGFTHPVTGQYMEFTSHYPDDLQEVLERFRSSSYDDVL